LIGSFRVTPDDPSFCDTGPAGGFLVFFPRTATRVSPSGGVPYVLDSTVVTIRNRGQEATRTPIDPRGVDGQWFAISGSSALEIARSLDPRAEPERPFRFTHAPCPPELYLRQRRLYLRARRGIATPLESSEGILRLVAAVIGSAFATFSSARGSARAPASDRTHRDLAARAKEALAADLSGAFRLGDLAARLDVSPFHLCRVFRRETGTTLARFHLDLRLCAALDRLDAAHGDLTGLALDFGFSSHSHFTYEFRRRFGVPPRRALADRPVPIS